MKVSIVTAVFNGIDFIEACICSVLTQDYINLEYIVIDGGSTDGTIEVLRRYRSRISIFESGPDLGYYDALNKGIQMASGVLVGVLNADDLFADQDVLSTVVHAFRLNRCDAVYGNLCMVDRWNPGQRIRCWDSRTYSRADLELGWMPPHPTLYLRKSLFVMYGGYDLNFGCSADYEMILRLLYTYRIKAFFLNKLMVIMRVGGMSNASFSVRFRTLFSDYCALKVSQVPRPFTALLGKKIRKLTQYVICYY